MTKPASFSNLEAEALEFINSHLSKFNIKIDNLALDQQIGFHLILLSDVLTENQKSRKLVKFNRYQDPVDFADAQKIFIEKGWMVSEMMLEYEKRSNVGYLLNVVKRRLKKPLAKKLKTVAPQSQPPTISYFTKPPVGLTILVLSEENFTSFEVVNKASSEKPEPIPHVFEIDNKNYQLDNFIFWILRGVNDDGVNDSIDTSRYSIVEDEVSKTVALIPASNPRLVITSKMIIKLLHDCIQKQCQSKFHLPVQKVFYTIPSLYSAFQRSQLGTYLKEAGFKEVEFIESASLIAAECSRQTKHPEKVLISSWSPTQFEVAIGEVQKGKADITDKIGRSAIGLIPLRRKVSKLLSKKLQEKFPSLNITPAILPLLDSSGNECLLKLSTQQTTDIHISILTPEINTTLTVTKDEVENSCGYPFSTIEKMFLSFTQDQPDISATCFKGSIIESAEYKEKIKKDLNLKQTQDFDVKSFSDVISDVNTGKVKTVPRLIYSILQNKLYSQVEKIFSRNTILPASKTMEWNTVSHFQSSFNFSFLEGERLVDIKNFKFGDFEFKYDQAHIGKAHEFPVEMHYNLDENGILRISCQCKDGSCKHTFTASLARLKQEHNYRPDQILADAEQNEISDKEYIREKCASERLRIAISNARSLLQRREYCVSLSEQSINAIGFIVDLFENFRNANQNASWQTLDSYYQNFLAQVNCYGMTLVEPEELLYKFL